MIVENEQCINYKAACIYLFFQERLEYKKFTKELQKADTAPVSNP